MTFYGTASPSADSGPARRGSMALAALASLGAAVAGALAWGLVAYLTKHQFSLVAVVIGVVVGGAVGKFRAGDPSPPRPARSWPCSAARSGRSWPWSSRPWAAGIGLATILGHLNVLLSAYPHTVGILGVVFWLVAAYLGFRTALGGAPRPAAPQARPSLAGGLAGRAGPAHAPGQPASPQPFFGPPGGRAGRASPGRADGPGVRPAEGPRSRHGEDR